MSAKRKTGPKLSSLFQENFSSSKAEIDNGSEEECYRGFNGDIRQQENISPVPDEIGLWSGYPIGLKKISTPINRDMSPSGQETGSNHDETSSSGQKDEDDEDDDDVDDLKTAPHDQERLKAFNMFVRLFVDENLDRIVPISKQPKEKIQAIIDSCTRQFPELAERARKRIRTYLKSCRRNKRTRDPATWSETSSRPTPAHLTSAIAEQLLAQACENESSNAKMMRLGMEPVSQPCPVIVNTSAVTTHSVSEPIASRTSFSLEALNSSAISNATNAGGLVFPFQNKSDYFNMLKTIPISNITTSSSEIHAKSSLTNSSATSSSGNISVGTNSLNGSMNNNSNFRPQRNMFSPGNTKTLYPSMNTTTGVTTNGPTDLSMKPTKPLLSHKLNPTEMAAVRQLITGYRESAAFLLRSADELEQLLLQQTT
ncbi:nucleolar protein 4-like isoform X1 [Diaphorina citri]|uniref:Nucleolar protein 4-like isoform X1 n=1 Tax=Diaphorina citri TaxID=121845 RepID=A0A3Q0J0X2_DIACI|nr:nucleolar protein 4-like isoform X1 [Diaphorina citri]